jgi:uncharacterized membrane protein
VQVRVATWWDSLVSTFWFLPGMFMAAALGLAVGLPLIDIRVDGWVIARFPWLEMTPSTAQQLMASIAGAMVTVAGVVFSITMVTLSIATSQLGPRLLRTFMRNLSTQIALGLFVGTSVYCLLILASVRVDEELIFVPHVSVLVGVLLAVVCLAVLIYFTHSVASLVQAPTIVSQVASDLDQVLLRVFPDGCDDRSSDSDDETDWQELLDRLGDPGFSVDAPFEGYMQSLDVERILAMAHEQDVVIHLLHRLGKFVVRDMPLAHVWWRQAAGDADHVGAALTGAITVGNRPTPVQDIESAVNELVELALRALSTGLNDPFTAMNCVDRLAASLKRLAARKIPAPVHRDRAGHVRLITPPLDFPTVLETAFNQIRQYGRTSVATTIQILEGLAVVGAAVRRDADRRAVALQADLVLKGAERALEESHDLVAVRQRHDKVRRALKSSR